MDGLEDKFGGGIRVFEEVVELDAEEGDLWTQVSEAASFFELLRLFRGQVSGVEAVLSGVLVSEGRAALFLGFLFVIDAEAVQGSFLGYAVGVWQFVQLLIQVFCSLHVGRVARHGSSCQGVNGSYSEGGVTPNPFGKLRTGLPLSQDGRGEGRRGGRPAGRPYEGQGSVGGDTWVEWDEGGFETRPYRESLAVSVGE